MHFDCVASVLLQSPFEVMASHADVSSDSTGSHTPVFFLPAQVHFPLLFFLQRNGDLWLSHFSSAAAESTHFFPFFTHEHPFALLHPFIFVKDEHAVSGSWHFFFALGLNVHPASMHLDFCLFVNEEHFPSACEGVGHIQSQHEHPSLSGSVIPFIAVSGHSGGGAAQHGGHSFVGGTSIIGSLGHLSESTTYEISHLPLVHFLTLQANPGGASPIISISPFLHSALIDTADTRAAARSRDAEIMAAVFIIFFLLIESEKCVLIQRLLYFWKTAAE